MRTRRLPDPLPRRRTTRAIAPLDGLGSVLKTALTHPGALTSVSAGTIGRSLKIGPRGQETCETALAALAAMLYARPDLVDEALLERFSGLPGSASLPDSIGKAVVTVFEFLAASPLAGQAWTRLRELLRDDRLPATNRDLLLPLVNDYARWREDLIGLDGALGLAECPTLGSHRAFLLDYVVERFVFTTPQAFTPEVLHRIDALFGRTPRYRYFLYALSSRPRLAPGADTLLARWLGNRLPFQRLAEALRGSRPFALLAVMNTRIGQGDEIVRMVPLLQSLLDANPALAVTVITRRTYLYDNPRVSTVSIDDGAAVDSAVAGRWDGVFEVFEPLVPEVAFRPDLHAAIERLLAERPPALVIRGDVGHNHFTYQAVAIDGHDVARASGLDRLGVENIYETGMRLGAELGLPQRAAEEPPLTPSILTGLRSADAERVWSALTGRGSRRARPVVLLNPFGGARATKGFLGQHRQLLSAEIAGLVDEGYLVVLLPNGMPWGGRRAIAEVLSPLGPAVRAMVKVAPDPADPRRAARLGLRERPELAPADRVMRLFKYFAGYADLVVTVEGWLTHLAYCLGRPLRLHLAAQSHSFDWHPWGRGREQRLAATLSARSRARYSASDLLGASDPPPLAASPAEELARARAGRPGPCGGPGCAVSRPAGQGEPGSRCAGLRDRCPGTGAAHPERQARPAGGPRGSRARRGPGGRRHPAPGPRRLQPGARAAIPRAGAGARPRLPSGLARGPAPRRLRASRALPRRGERQRRDSSRGPTHPPPGLAPRPGPAASPYDRTRARCLGSRSRRAQSACLTRYSSLSGSCLAASS
jgi:hypothetical protein